MKRAPDTRSIRRLPTAFTAPPPRPRDMPEARIVIWTPGRALAAFLRSIADAFVKPSRDVLVTRLRDEA